MKTTGYQMAGIAAFSMPKRRVTTCQLHQTSNLARRRPCVSNPTPLPVSPHVHASAPHRESDATLIRQVRSKQAKIAVIGMGHVGLPTALGFASQGWSVIGADSSLPLISLLQAG